MKRKPSELTPQRLFQWRMKHGWKQAMAASRLGIGASTYYQYEDGRVKIPVPIAYACAAIDAGLEPLK